MSTQQLISSPPAPPPQQFTNLATLIDGQANVAAVMLFLNNIPVAGNPGLPGGGLPGGFLPGFGGDPPVGYGFLLTEGRDYTRSGGRVTMTVPPTEGEVLTAIVFPIGVALGGPTATRFGSPWELALPLDGAYDGVSTAYKIVFGPTIVGDVDGVNRLFSWGVVLRRARVFRNGILQTQNVDVLVGTTAMRFLTGAVPVTGDAITMLGWP